MVAVLNPVNPSIATTSNPLRQRGSRRASLVLNTALDWPCTMSSNRAGPVPSRIPGEVDDHGDALVSVQGVPPHVLIDTQHPHTLGPRRSVDQQTLALGQDRVVRGVPRDAQWLRRCGPRSGARPRARASAHRACAGTASTRPVRPWWCPDATRARSRCSGTGSRPEWWVANPAARAPAAG